jgi:hypothetical protein
LIFGDFAIGEHLTAHLLPNPVSYLCCHPLSRTLIYPNLDDYPIRLESDSYPEQTGNSTGFFYHDLHGNKWLITARHNIYPIPPKDNNKKSRKDAGYCETLVSKLIMRFGKHQSLPGKYPLSQKTLLSYGRISKHHELDIAAINLSDLLTGDRLLKKYYSKRSFFTEENLASIGDCDTGNMVRVTGYSEQVGSSNYTTLRQYLGKIKAKNKGVSDACRRYMFAVDIRCPVGISGSPVILEVENNTRGPILLGSYSGVDNPNKMGFVTYSNLIDRVTKSGINLHKNEWHSNLPW